MTQSRLPITAPGEAPEDTAIFEAYRPIEWTESFAEHYDALTASIGAIAAELGITTVDIPEQRPTNLTIVSSALLLDVRRKACNGDFSREVITDLEKAGQGAPLTVTVRTKLIGLPAFSGAGTPTAENDYFSLRIDGLADEQRSLLDVVVDTANKGLPAKDTLSKEDADTKNTQDAEGTEEAKKDKRVKIVPLHLHIPVAGIRSSDWDEHHRAFIDGIDRHVLHQKVELGRLILPTHVGAV